MAGRKLVRDLFLHRQPLFLQSQQQVRSFKQVAHQRLKLSVVYEVILILILPVFFAEIGSEHENSIAFGKWVFGESSIQCLQ